MDRVQCHMLSISIHKKEDQYPSGHLLMAIWICVNVGRRRRESEVVTAWVSLSFKNAFMAQHISTDLAHPFQ